MIKKKYLKVIVSLIVFSLLTVSIIYFYVYKEHRNISSEKPDFELNALQLIKEFDNDVSNANQKYADKTISTYGIITGLDLNYKMIVVDEKIVVVFANPVDQTVEVGDTLKFKGRFVGFDELFNELKIDQAVIIK